MFSRCTGQKGEGHSRLKEQREQGYKGMKHHGIGEKVQANLTYTVL